ncbi:MAG: Tryptophan synthase alpha chain [Labilithrix sp.]|nr:Tryptophan synthase alpha chain [Labilithrix sp.]
MRVRRLAFALVPVAVLVASCSSASERGTFDETPAPAQTGTAAPSPPPLGDNTDHRAVPVTFEGTVLAPNGSLPLSNALVYVTQQAPAAIPEGAYCDECVTLQDGTFAISAPDGKFTFTTDLPKGKAWLVVQKGQFRRVRPVTIEKEGTIAVAKDDSTIPGHADVAKGDDIPKMVILKDDTDFDRIDDSLTKLGIAGVEVRTDRSLLKNKAELMKYHVVFIPCGESDDPLSTDPVAKQNLDEFVQAGGKLYVTDWSYEFVRQPFPGFFSWADETQTLGSAASGDEWDAPATAADPGLGDWLTATGDASFEVKGNWTKLTAVNVRQGLDEKGASVDVTPKVWVTAQNGSSSAVIPTTVSFQNKCGRVLFSTYHTESGVGGGGGSALLAQEKALLYVLLEVGVCVGERPGVK